VQSAQGQAAARLWAGAGPAVPSAAAQALPRPGDEEAGKVSMYRCCDKVERTYFSEGKQV